MEKKDKEKKVIVTLVFKNSVKENLEFLSENIPDYAENFINELEKKLRDISRYPNHYQIEPKINPRSPKSQKNQRLTEKEI
ncbi:MAG: hypothetical protein SFU98_18910 [Leptospiraceae bacterium]|nr:hypothetical protein [Leptospiraceae bacterium]